MSNRFAFVRELSDGQEQLLLAEMFGQLSFRWPFRASIYAEVGQEMHRVVGVGSFAGNGTTIEQFQWISISPSGRYLATYAHEVGTRGFFNDHDIKIFDLTDGSLALQFNEHSMSASKSTCTTPFFDYHLAELRRVGFAETEIANTDFELDTEETISQVGNPEFHWLSDESFVVKQSFEVLVVHSPLGLGFSEAYVFDFKFEKTATGWDGPKECNQNPGPYPAQPSSSIRVGPFQTGGAHPEKIHHFTRPTIKLSSAPISPVTGSWSPLRFKKTGWFRKSKYTLRTAKFAAGRPTPKKTFILSRR